MNQPRTDATTAEPTPGGMGLPLMWGGSHRTRLGEVFRFEVVYQAGRAWLWLTFAALAGFAFLFVRVNFIADAVYTEAFLNTPFLIAGATVIGSVVWLLVSAVVTGEAAARDVQTRMHPLVYTTRVGERAYLAGRFLAAFAVNAVLLLAVQVGILLAFHAPGLAPALVGPFRPAAYLTAYGFVALPTALVATALQFAFAARSGKTMAGYAGSLLLVFMGFFVAGALLWGKSLGSLLDPIGIRFVVEDLAHAWTPAEKATRLLALEGALLTNRLLWSGLALAALAATFLRFRFAHRPERPGRLAQLLGRRRARGRDVEAPVPGPFVRVGVVDGPPVSVPRVPRTFGVGVDVRQALAVAGDSFRSIATSRVGLAMLVGLPLLAVPVVADQMTSELAPLVPTTGRVLAELTSPLSAELSRWVIVPLLIIFFAGELVWRERDAGLGEMTDAMPGSEWAPLVGKVLGLGLVLALFLALLMGAGILAQALMGYRKFEVGLYTTVLFGLQLPEYLLFAVLALVVHVVADQKYVGHLAATAAYVFVALPSVFGVEHGLLVYGSGPGWTYSEMSGLGSSLGPWAWFKAYWAAWALLLLVGARLLWVRGREGSLRARVRTARHRATRPTVWTAAAGAGLVVLLGGFVFYNTNVLHDYLDASELAERSAEYERRYGRYRDAPQPQLAGVSLRVEIYPDQRAVEIEGAYALVNRSAGPIDTLHVTTVPEAETAGLKFDRPAALVLDDEAFGHRVYALERPLQPGDSLALRFEVDIEPRGFSEGGAAPAVVANGTYFTDEWLPGIGYKRSRELTLTTDRREHGLPPRPLVPPLSAHDPEAGAGGGIDFEAIVGTAVDQVPVAPGAPGRSWTEGDRRYVHYVTDVPIGTDLFFFSADYAVREARWEPPGDSGRAVAIRIYHHPGHTANLDRMVRGVRSSLDVYSEEFGPYPYGHLTLVEHPGDGDGVGVHAVPSLLVYEEGFSLLDPDDDPATLDHPFAVIAHEVAHQWTVPYAFVEGGPVMSESVAWYYAMRAVERALGPEHLRRLLSFMRGTRRPIHMGVPLIRGLDPYLSYRKGPMALYALSETVGEDRVHLALRRLVEAHDGEGAPLATTLDLVGELRAVTPDSLQYLLRDLFERNVAWEFETKLATAEPTGAGAWLVTLDVQARKAVVDSAGVETEVPLDEWVEVGVFGPPTDGGDALSRPLYERAHRLRSGQQRVTVTVPRRPALAGVDPYRLLDWEDGGGDDNVQRVTVRE